MSVQEMEALQLAAQLRCRLGFGKVSHSNPPIPHCCYWIIRKVWTNIPSFIPERRVLPLYPEEEYMLQALALAREAF